MITLTNALSYSEGTTVLETDSNGAFVNMRQNWQGADHLTGVLAYGNMVSGNFVQGQRPQTIQILFNFQNGAWQTTNGLSGTLTSAQLDQIVSILKQARNFVEQFAASQGIMPGTQTPW